MSKGAYFEAEPTRGERGDAFSFEAVRLFLRFFGVENESSHPSNWGKVSLRELLR